jgi:GntR family transcriptional regulator
MTVGKPISAADRERPSPTPIVFKLDPASGVPTYLQLVRQVEHALLLGYLAPGDQLPKVRDVVADLAINPNTVLKAYRDLEQKGIAAGRPGLGTFVESGAGQGMLPELAALRRRLRRWLADADASGLEENSIVALFTTTLRDFTEGRGVDDSRGADGGSPARSAGGAA